MQNSPSLTSHTNFREQFFAPISAALEGFDVKNLNLGRPYCDTLKGTKSGKLKELRIQVSGDPYRVLFAFDSEQCAILLVGGNKRGEKRWSEIHIPQAEDYLMYGKSSDVDNVPLRKRSCKSHENRLSPVII